MSNHDWTIHNIIDFQSVFTEADRENKNITSEAFACIGNTHTHGLDKYDHPELCIVLNLDPYITGNILNSMGERIRGGIARFSTGRSKIVLQGDYEVEIIKFPKEETLYILLPDPDNKLPGDEGCQAPYCYQKLYAKLIHDYNLQNGLA